MILLLWHAPVFCFASFTTKMLKSSRLSSHKKMSGYLYLLKKQLIFKFADATTLC